VRANAGVEQDRHPAVLRHYFQGCSTPRDVVFTNLTLDGNDGTSFLRNNRYGSLTHRSIVGKPYSVVAIKSATLTSQRGSER
jgi:hypothetical protein